MKRSITSADLLRYNANTAGVSSPDCVKRAISYAFDKSYIQVAKDLNAEMKRIRYDQWNVPVVYATVIKNYGGSGRTVLQDFDSSLDKNTTTEMFADLYNTGTYILEVGKTPDGRSSHLVAVVDGQVIDSWDSRKWYVKKLYTTNRQHAAVSNIWDDENKAKLKEIAREACMVNYEKLSSRIASKNGWTFDPPDQDMFVGNYSIISHIATRIHWGEDGSNKVYVEVRFTFTPTMSFDQAVKYIKDTAYVRTYDRLYEANKRIAGLIEQYTVEKELREKESVGDQIGQQIDRYYMDSREKRFFNSLPGSLRGRIRYVRIQQPGQFSDSYQVSVIPVDDRTNDYREKYVNFEAYTASDMKDMLQRYAEKGEVPFVDYEPAEEY